MKTPEVRMVRPWEQVASEYNRRHPEHPMSRALAYWYYRKAEDKIVAGLGLTREAMDAAGLTVGDVLAMGGK